MNKKADVPIIILVVGIIGICAMAILSFLISEKVEYEENPVEVELLEEIHSDVEKFCLYKNLGLSDEEAVSNVNELITEKGKKLTIENENNLLSIKRTSESGILSVTYKANLNKLCGFD